MRRFVESRDRGQSTPFPECLEDWIGEDNPVRVIDVFADELDLGELGFSGADPEVTGRPSLSSFGTAEAARLRLSQSGRSSRRLEREAGRNVEVMWLTGRLAPDHSTIADFRKHGAMLSPVLRAVTLMQHSRLFFAEPQCCAFSVLDYFHIRGSP